MPHAYGLSAPVCEHVDDVDDDDGARRTRPRLTRAGQILSIDTSAWDSSPRRSAVCTPRRATPCRSRARALRYTARGRSAHVAGDDNSMTSLPRVCGPVQPACVSIFHSTFCIFCIAI